MSAAVRVEAVASGDGPEVPRLLPDASLSLLQSKGSADACAVRHYWMALGRPNGGGYSPFMGFRWIDIDELPDLFDDGRQLIP